VDAEEIFIRFVWPLYPEDARADLASARSVDANPGKNPSPLLHLDDAAHRFVAQSRALFGRDLGLDRSDASVYRLSTALTIDRRNAWAASGRPGDPDNTLFNVIVHGAAYVGACIVAGHGGVWRVRRPLWESFVGLHSHAGDADLAVFQWWLKSLSDEAIGEERPSGARLADRYRTHVEVPRRRPDGDPFVRGERLLPRLKRPAYDRLHKYLRAHLPEIKDLGADFPDAARFADFSFRWMDALVVGGGRRVVLAGASPHGIHLFWMGANGFEKSAFVAGDAMPEPIVRVGSDRITVMTTNHGRVQAYEVLWWGP
jgi:hypothetical protein